MKLFNDDDGSAGDCYSISTLMKVKICNHVGGLLAIIRKKTDGHEDGAHEDAAHEDDAESLEECGNGDAI